MRKKIVAGNWKMNLNYSDALELLTNITDFVYELKDENVEVIIAPAFPYLKDAVEIVSSYSHVCIASQNCAFKENGAYTGEVSAAMLQSLGVKYVILGHSERRIYFNESNETVKQKIDLAIANHLKPIVCVGELLDERKSDLHFSVIEKQIFECTNHLTNAQFDNIIIAYEPVWAIGTGLTATPAQAQEMHAFIRQCIAKNSTALVAENISILYGGSCNENNAQELFSCNDIDGGLIGGASLKAESFYKIITSL
jgi:triosephosphate isomerase (TIM)